MSSDLMLDVGQAAELKEAFRRAGYTNELIKKLCWKNGVLEGVRAVLLGNAEIKPISELQSWIDLYRDCFGIELDVQSLTFPVEAENTWLVIADERVTNNQVYDACKKLFSCWKYADDLNQITDLHISGTTARRFRAVVEADEEMKNRSADDNKTAGLTPKSITLKERMLLELWYFRKTGNHLDIQHITLCDGSRYPDGRVPGVDWGDGEMGVDWCHSGDRHECLRSRQAVS